MTTLLTAKEANLLIPMLKDDQIIFWKDLNGHIIYSNQYFADIANVKSFNLLINSNLFSDYMTCSKSIASVKEDDERVYYEKQKHLATKKLCYKYSNEIVLSSWLHPVFNPNTKKVESIICIGDKKLNLKRLAFKDLYKTITPEYLSEFVNKKSYQIASKHNITKKEAHLLLYLIVGKSLKKISNLENNSVRTIENRIYNLKHKLNCYNKNDLIDFVLQSDFLDSF